MNTTIAKLLATRDVNWRFPSTVYDTFSALHTIARHDPHILHGEPMGQILALLISVEGAPGGPYYSDFSVDQTQPQVYDRQTNAAIAQFLSCYDVRLPQLDAFLRNTSPTITQTPITETQWAAQERHILDDIRTCIKRQLTHMDPDCRARAIDAIERTITGNPDKQMTLMPYYTHLAFGASAHKISRDRVVHMGAMNAFFWTAFIIYDDFWDLDPAADPRLLPIANTFARYYTDFYTSLFPETPGFRLFFHRLMDALDSANVWDTSCCRATVQESILTVPDVLPKYGNYSRKYHPASGHIMGPVALLAMAGQGIDSDDTEHLISYFKHYLIAMQLNDDMHDWLEDLERGTISTVVDMLLCDYGKERINLVDDIDAVREVFWFTTLPRVASLALRHTAKSRRALHKVTCIEDFAPLEQFIDRPERIAREALDNYHYSVGLIKGYRTANFRKN